MSCAHCRDADRFFTNRTAKRELRRYRKKGPTGATGKLVEALKSEGVENATLLDIGGGVGVIQHELLEAGAREAVGVDAASVYLETARAEAERRGNGDSVHGLMGDFLDLSGDVEPADVVTLDKVICCYPDMQELVARSVGKARRLYGIVVPRETRLVRAAFAGFNLWLRLRRSTFRAFVHPVADMERLIGQAGFEKQFSGQAEFMWNVLVYTRTESVSQ